MKYLVILICFTLLGCDKAVEIDAVVTDVFDNPRCVPPDRMISVLTITGERSSFCANTYVKVGDKIHGYWSDGYANPSTRGFSFTKP
jgi:hypothetical protein